MGQPQRLGHKQSKGHSRFKKFIAGSVALGGLALGVKADQEIKKAKNDQFELSRGNFADLSSEAGLKKMGTGTEVVGVDARGNIYGGAGVQAGQGVEANPNIRRGAQGQLPVGALSPAQLAPFNKKAEGLRAVAGVVGGQIGVGEAVRDVARAGFEGAGGRRGNNPLQDFKNKQERGAQAGGSVVVGAEGIKASNKELAGQLGRKVKNFLPFGG